MQTNSKTGAERQTDRHTKRKEKRKIQQLNIGNYYTDWVHRTLEKSGNLVYFSFVRLCKLTRNPDLRFWSTLRSGNGPRQDFPDHNEQYSPGWVSGGVPSLYRQFSVYCVRLLYPELYWNTVEVVAVRLYALGFLLTWSLYCIHINLFVLSTMQLKWEKWFFFLSFLFFYSLLFVCSHLQYWFRKVTISWNFLQHWLIKT